MDGSTILFCCLCSFCAGVLLTLVALMLVCRSWLRSSYDDKKYPGS